MIDAFGHGRARMVRAILGCIVLIEAIAVIGYGVFLGVETVVATATQRSAAAVLAALVVAIGAALAVLARAALGGRRGARAPIVVWQILQASVGYPALSTLWYAGVALIACAMLAIVAVFIPGVIEDGVVEDGAARDE